jgi:hypothetical protein
MSRRLSVVVVLLFAVACSDGSSSTASSPEAVASVTSLPIDRSIAIRILPNLDGNNVTVTSFNQYDEVAGYTTTASGLQIFRSRRTIEYFTPPPHWFVPSSTFIEMSQQVGINSGGWVVASLEADSANVDTAYSAVIWWHNGGTTQYQPTYMFFYGSTPLGCGALAINDSGYVAGGCMPNVNEFIAEWAPNGTIIRNDCCGTAVAISDNGWLAGYSNLQSVPQAMVWQPGAALYSVLGVFGGMPEVSEGLGVNQSGWVAGWAELDSTGYQPGAVLWVPGQSQRILSHLGQATGVDSAGDVVGFHQETANGPSIAFLWNVATGAHFLPGLPGGGQTAAVAINGPNRQILGWAIDSHGLKHAVIWTF